MNTCETCKWWIKIPDAIARDYGNPEAVNESFGHCSNPKLDPSKKLDNTTGLLWSDTGIPIFETGKNFGCIHHER